MCLEYRQHSRVGSSVKSKTSSSLFTFFRVHLILFPFPKSCLTQGKPEPRAPHLHPTPPGKVALCGLPWRNHPISLTLLKWHVPIIRWPLLQATLYQSASWGRKPIPQNITSPGLSLLLTLTNNPSLPIWQDIPQFVVSTADNDWFSVASRAKAGGCSDVMVWVQCALTQTAGTLLSAHGYCLRVPDWFLVNRKNLELPRTRYLKLIWAQSQTTYSSPS